MQAVNTRFDELKNYFDFLWAITEKEIKARYKRAVFGFLWVFLNPVLQMLIIGAIFQFFIKMPNYFLFLFSGLLPWQFFSLSLTKATPSIVYERALLQKAKFPIETIPISIVLSNFVHMLFSFLVFLPIIFFIVRPPLVNLLIVALALVWLFILTTGLTLLASSLNVKYRDMSFFVQTLLILLFYATPILYNLSLLPESKRLIFSLNPLSSIFELLHIGFFNEGRINAFLLVNNIIMSLFLISISIGVFNKNSKYFVDYL